MIFDMQEQGTLVAEVNAFCDWPYTPPAKAGVKDTISVRATSSSTSRANASPDGTTPSPPDRVSPLT